MFEVRDRGRKQLDFGIQPAQRKVIGRKLGVQSEVYVRSLGRIGLRVGSRLLHRAPHAAPEIRLPTGLPRNRQVGVSSGAVFIPIRRIQRILYALGCHARRKRGIQVGARRTHLVSRRKVSLERLLELHIVGGDALFQLVELRVLVNLPPFALQHAVGGIGRLPCAAGWIRRRRHRRRARLLIYRRRVVAGAIVVRTHRLAAGSEAGSKRAREQVAPAS